MLNTKYETADGTMTIRLSGEMDSVTAPAFGEELFEELEGVKHLVIDFEELEYISSAGLRVLLTAQQRVEKANADMKIIHVNENIMEIFDLVGFTEVITVE